MKFVRRQSVRRFAEEDIQDLEACRRIWDACGDRVSMVM